MSKKIFIPLFFCLLWHRDFATGIWSRWRSTLNSLAEEGGFRASFSLPHFLTGFLGLDEESVSLRNSWCLRPCVFIRQCCVHNTVPHLYDIVNIIYYCVFMSDYVALPHILILGCLLVANMFDYQWKNTQHCTYYFMYYFTIIWNYVWDSQDLMDDSYFAEYISSWEGELMIVLF